jgi:hypothetical protein
VCQPPNRQIGKSGEDLGQMVAQRELQPPTAFHDRENRCDLRSRLWAAYVDPVLSTQSHRRIEFFARLLLNSSSGYSRNRLSLLHSVSAYWQALLNALEGNATDCADSILLRIILR